VTAISLDSKKNFWVTGQQHSDKEYMEFMSNFWEPLDSNPDDRYVQITLDHTPKCWRRIFCEYRMNSVYIDNFLHSTENN